MPPAVGASGPRAPPSRLSRSPRRGSTPDPSPYTGPGPRPLNGAELEYLEQARRWDQTESGYTAIQSTKPQTLGYALNDSPAGLAAWILEKWRSWSDCHGDPVSRFSRDFL